MWPVSSKKDPFWAFGPMIFTKFEHRMELFEPTDFFEKADRILKARPNYSFFAGQDEFDLRDGILNGHVSGSRIERYDDTSRHFYQCFLDGSFEPRRRHQFKKPISAELLLDFLSAAAYSNSAIWAECRPLLEHDRSTQVVKVMELTKFSSCWIARKLRLLPTIRFEVSFLTEDIIRLLGDGQQFGVYMKGSAVFVGPYGVNTCGLSLIDTYERWYNSE